MSDAYRDENESLRARNTQLENDLRQRNQTLEELERKLGDHDAVFDRLRGVIDQKTARREGRFKTFRGGPLFGIVGVAVALVSIVAGAVYGKTSAAAEPRTPSPQQTPNSALPSYPDRLPASPLPEALPPIDVKNLCSRLGIRITVGGADAEALATGTRDGSGSKYRRNGDRAVYLTVAGFSEREKAGSLYIHGWGSDMPRDTGTSKLTLFDIMTKGETGGYTLARDGKSMLEVLGTDGKNAWGRFEADMSRVGDVTRTPPFGTPVVRVRGNFCLPFRPGDPKDTGP